MHPLITPILIGLFFAGMICQSQTITIIHEDRNYYNTVEQKGSYYQGKPVGKWLDVSNDSIIYKEYYYDSLGVPCNTWRLFYPDGKLRKEFQFIESRVAKYTRYSLNSDKQIELSSSRGIYENVLKKVNDLEERMFITEGRRREVIYNEGMGHSREYGTKWVMDYYKVMDWFIEEATDSLFSGNLDLWHEDGRHWKRYTFEAGRVKYISDIQDWKRNLVEQDEYDSGKLLKKTFYNTDGTIKRIKTF